MLSKIYQNMIDKFWWSNATFHYPSTINSFEVILDVFHAIQDKSDFQHFRNNFPPEWIYIPAIKLRNKKLWLQIFEYIYEYHLNNDQKFADVMSKKMIESKKSFMHELEKKYDEIIWYGGMTYDKDEDLTVTFCRENTFQVIQKYCATKKINEFNTDVIIHPLERKWSINKVLFYRATQQNNYSDKMLDDYDEWKNTKRLCQDFIKYNYE